MYIPPTFQETRIEVMHALMRTHPLGILISHGPAGLQASAVPFLTCAEGGEFGTLRAHMARANRHWQELADATECLVIFQGPQGYVTPSWYPSKQKTHKVVPTWNYATVHAWGKAKIVADAIWLRRQLDELTVSQEGGRPQPWAIGDAPAEYIATQMKSIVGIEIPIARLEGKWKMSQNRDAADRQGVIDGLRTADDPHRNPTLAQLVADRFQAAPGAER